MPLNLKKVAGVSQGCLFCQPQAASVRQFFTCRSPPSCKLHTCFPHKHPSIISLNLTKFNRHGVAADCNYALWTLLYYIFFTFIFITGCHFISVSFTWACDCLSGMWKTTYIVSTHPGKYKFSNWRPSQMTNSTE